MKSNLHPLWLLLRLSLLLLNKLVPRVFNLASRTLLHPASSLWMTIFSSNSFLEEFQKLSMKTRMEKNRKTTLNSLLLRGLLSPTWKTLSRRKAKTPAELLATSGNSLVNMLMLRSLSFLIQMGVVKLTEKTCKNVPKQWAGMSSNWMNS